MFRTAVGKLLYLALDRVDINYAVGQLSRSLSKPVEQLELDMMHFRRCARYLSGTLGASMCLHQKSVSCFVVCLNGN
eukprot:4239331-Amphidinium_carterae.1